MSLVGNLEDLGLGDIMQIITLSRKSGALCLRSDQREGRVVFRDGLVCCAAVKGRTPDLRGLVVGEGALTDEAFEAAQADASARSVELAVALADALTPARFETLRRECVEAAVLEMFGWETGDFSFEVGEDAPDDDFAVVLEAGINAQYLAMEGTRRTDEDRHEAAADPGDVASFADLAEEIDEEDAAEAAPEVVAAPDAGPADAVEAVAFASVQRVEESDGTVPPVDEAAQTVPPADEAALPPAVAVAAPEATEAVAEATVPPAPVRTEAAVEEAFASALYGAGGSDSDQEAVVEAAPPADLPAPAERPPVVIVDAALPLLEWLKDTLEGAFPRIHIFQQAELAVGRLRQYVARGDWPLVLISPTLPIDGAHGWNDVDELVARIKRQSPRSVVLWLGERGEIGPADGEVVRPPDPSVVHLSGRDPLVGESLRNSLLSAIGGVASAELANTATTLGFEEVRARLADPEVRGEVLNLALGFAGGVFRRVALFAVRGNEATGLAQSRLAVAGGPDDEALQAIRVRVAESAWLARLVETRSPVRGPAEGEEDARLCAQLGDALPADAWLGPVVSGGQVVAFLYGDELPEDRRVGPTGELETVLADAGRALDAAVAERAQGER